MGLFHIGRWIFVERYMQTLKGFVRWRAKHEGNIIVGYLLQETMKMLHDEIV